MEFEVHALLLALLSQLAHLGTHLLGTLGSLRDFILQLRDACIALRECSLVVLACLGDTVVGTGGYGSTLVAIHLRR